MGVPSYARVLAEENPSTTSSATDEVVDHFFLDFNSMIYFCYASLDKQETKELTNSQLENMLNKKVVEHVKSTIAFVAPQRSVYIAFDGPPPCAKIHQQRFRRYKSIYLQQIKDSINQKHGIEKTRNWNTSCNIAPGTRFMTKLSSALQSAIKSGSMSAYCDHKIEFTFSDSNVPGEGEHKYMDMIRDLEKTRPNDTVVVLSPDADVIILSIASHKSKIKLLRSVNEMNYTKKLYKGHEFYYLIIDEIKRLFLAEMLGEDNSKYDIKRVVIDYILLSCMAGNDFVIPIPYLKIKLDKLRTPMRVYRKLLKQRDEYLVIIDGEGEYSLNTSMLREMMKELTKTEEFSMRKIQKSIHRDRKATHLDRRTVEMEKDMKPHEVELSRVEHKPFYSPFNPLFDRYNREFDKLNFFQEKPKWKRQYYSYFLGNEKSGRISDLVKNYLEGLMFVVNYYFKGPPSWTWFYRYRIAPLPGEIFKYLSGVDDANKEINFDLGQPIAPLDQLMVILPPQMANILPKCYRDLMLKEDSPLKDLYPHSFELDVYPGQKLIYTEPLLPELDISRVLASTLKVADILNAAEVKRNTNISQPLTILK